MSFERKKTEIPINISRLAPWDFRKNARQTILKGTDGEYITLDIRRRKLIKQCGG